MEELEALVTTESPPTTSSSLSPSPTVLSTTVPPSMTSHVMSVTRQTMTSRRSSEGSPKTWSPYPSDGGTTPDEGTTYPEGTIWDTTTEKGSTSVTFTTPDERRTTVLSTTVSPMISSHMMSSNSHVMSVTRPRMTPMGKRKKATRGKRFA